MPNYLQADQIITVSFRGINAVSGYVVSFDPSTGDVNWWGCTPGADTAANRLDTLGSPIFVLPNGARWNDPVDVWVPDTYGIGAAVNAARTRLFVFFKFYFVYIYDENLTLLDTVDLSQYIDAGSIEYIVTHAVAALPNGNFLLFVEVYDPARNASEDFGDFLEITEDGAFVARHLTTTPTTWATLKILTPIAVSKDGQQVAYIEPVDFLGQPWDGAGAPTRPPALIEGDPDNMTGPWGNVVRVYDLINDAELGTVDVDADPIKFGIGYAASKQILTGSAGQALSCSPVNNHCALVNTTFGPGFVTRETITGARKALYRADADLVWFEEQDDWLQRNSSSFFDPTQDWRVDLRVVFGSNGPGADYQTVWFMGATSYTDGWIWLGASTTTWEFNIGNGVTTTVAVALGTVVPYHEYRFSARYSKAHHRIETWLNDVLIATSAVDMVAIDVDAATEMLGSDADATSRPDLGVSRVKHFQNGNLVANTPLLDASATNDTRPTGRDWVRNGSLADDDVAVDRYGDERGAVGVDALGLRFWHAKYVRQLSNSRLMLVERNISSGLRTRFFLVPWMDWEGSTSPYAWYPTIHDIIPVLTPQTIVDDDIVGEETFLAGGVSGPLCWIEMTVREGN